MINKDMKLIPKAQYGAQFIAQSDNTRVAKPIIQERILYKLKPNEFYFVDKKTGKRIIGRQKQEVISSDNRTTNQRKQDQTTAKQIQKKQEADKNYNEGLKTIGALTTLAMPSTYIGPVFNNNGKSYLDNVISGEGTGDAAGNLAIDLATPLAISKVSKIAQTVPKTVGQKYVAPYISSKMLNRSIKANPNIRDINNLFNTNFINRNTVFGKNSGKAIHADYGDNTGGFTKGTTGASINNDRLIPGHNPNTEVDYIWWNVDKPYATGINGRAFTRYIIKDEKSIPGIINIREQSRPIGQWNGKSGFVSKSERVTQEPVPLDDATIIEYNPITRVYENKLILPDKRLNINTFNSFDLSSSLKNGQWDMPTITQQLRNGTLKAREFLNSETRLSTYARNKELAKRLGFGTIEEPYNSTARANKPFQPKLTANNSTEGGSFIPGKQPQQDIIEINLAHQVEPAAFHESLHRGSYGMGSLEGLDNMSEFRNTNRFYEYLSDKLKKPWPSQPTSMRDYLDKPGELPVNVLELGQRMGIQIGQKYPGKIKFNTIIDQFKRNNPNDGKLFILDYLNMNKPKRVWDALSGQYFTALPAIYGGYKTIEE